MDKKIFDEIREVALYIRGDVSDAIAVAVIEGYARIRAAQIVAETKTISRPPPRRL
jgi:hypothetical protein